MNISVNIDSSSISDVYREGTYCRPDGKSSRLYEGANAYFVVGGCPAGEKYRVTVYYEGNLSSGKFSKKAYKDVCTIREVRDLMPSYRERDLDIDFDKFVSDNEMVIC